jgi:hypothetical protein
VHMQCMHGDIAMAHPNPELPRHDMHVATLPLRAHRINESWNQLILLHFTASYKNVWKVHPYSSTWSNPRRTKSLAISLSFFREQYRLILLYNISLHLKAKVRSHFTFVLYCLVEGKQTRSFNDTERGGVADRRKRQRDHERTEQDRPRRHMHVRGPDLDATGSGQKPKIDRWS